MSTPWILHRLYTLDPSSLDFLRHLYCLIQHDEEDQYLSSLQGPELTRLVDFLDEVRALLLAFFPATKRALQALSAISTNDKVSRQCLRKLQAICGHRAVLPSSYIISNEVTRVGDGPIALGPIADVWEGDHRGKRVSIKSLRVSLDDDETLKKVRVPYGTSSLRLLKKICGRRRRCLKRSLSGRG